MKEVKKHSVVVLLRKWLRCELVGVSIKFEGDLESSGRLQLVGGSPPVFRKGIQFGELPVPVSDH